MKLSELEGKTIQSIEKASHFMTIHFSDNSYLELEGGTERFNEYDENYYIDAEFYDKNGNLFVLDE